MGIEIERKFLVSSDGWRTAAHRVIPMAQGYINDMGALDRGTQNASVRVRIEGDHAALNLKSRTIGHTRQEFDYPIPVEDARALLALCVGGLIDKRRHLVEHAGLTWEVDEFLGNNAGLVVAEGWVERRGRSTCFFEGRLTDASGKVLAKASSTLMLASRERVEQAAKKAVG